MKTLDTIVEDIYSVFEDGAEVPQDLCDELGSKLANVIKDRIEAINEERDHTRLRVSSIGKCKRNLWYNSRDNSPEQPSPSNKIRFLYGDICEELLLFLAKLSGHTVEGEQDEMELAGIKGHRDCVIDGVVVDIKTASPYAFKKFSHGELLQEGNDPFGYVAQLSSYVQANSGKPYSENDDRGAFLAMDKSSGELALLVLEDILQIDAEQRIQEVKEAVASETPPEPEVKEKTEKNGSRTLASTCSFCQYKRDCWKDSNDGKGLRTFRYSNGLKHFTHIEGKPPRVEEIDYDE